MRDLRDKVERERSLLKRIELAIPGFRGYRKREDLRIADSMLRDYIARKLDSVEDNAKKLRDKLTEMMALDVINYAGKIVNRVSEMEERVRHAEQGYMGLVGDYSVDVDELNRLYEFDLFLIEGVQNLLEYSDELARVDDPEKVRSMMEEFVKMLDDFERKFERRRDVMLEVFT